MSLGVVVFLWLTITGCVDSYIISNCASFTDVNHKPFAQRTVTLSFKINNTCAEDTVREVYAYYIKPNGDYGGTLCQFKLPNGTCDNTVTQSIGCMCDDQGTFRVTAVLKDDQPEVWVLEGYISSGEWLKAEHTVKADELTTTTTRTKEFPSTDSTGNTFNSTTEEIETTDSTRNTTAKESRPTIDCTVCNTSDEFRTRMIVVLIIMAAVLFLILICTCILYCTA